MEPRSAFERQEEITLVDVREPWEREAGWIEGSMHIPLGQLPLRHPEIDADDTLVMVCRSGVRSEEAAGFLRSLGFADVHNLDGGLIRWTTAGLPFEGSVV